MPTKSLQGGQWRTLHLTDDGRKRDPMTEQPPLAQRSSGPDLSTLSTDVADIEREELDRAWAEFSRARASLAEVMSDDELRAFGFNVEVLDERP